MTYADIILYNEIKTVTVLHKKEINQTTMAALSNWFKAIKGLKEVIEANSKFIDIAKMYYLI